MAEKFNTDIIGGIIGLVITVFFWFSREGVTHLSIMFPNALLILMAVFSAAIIIKGFVRADRQPIFSNGDQRRIAVTAAILFLWVVAIVWIGFYVASVLMFSFLAYYLASARIKVRLSQFAIWVVIIAGLVGFFYFIFAKLLYVPLPRGILF